jgi:Mg2+/Co2+ transporter CorC
LDPSQHSSILFFNILWTGLLALADCRLSWLEAGSGTFGRIRRWALGPALRVGVRAGLAFGLVALFGLSGLGFAASVIFATGIFFVVAVFFSDRLLPGLAAQRAAKAPESGATDNTAGQSPGAALSVVASRAKRLEYVPASSLMVPRRSIVGCESSATVEEAASLMRETGLSRIIAYSKNIDRPLGFAHIKDVLPKVYGRGGHSTVESILRPLVLAPSSMRALDLLRDFQRLKRRVAIVRDLQGERTLGLISAEDILEELVGEIHDEHEGPLSSALDSGVALVRADLKVEDLLTGLGASMEGLEKELTVGRLVQSSLEKRAETGDIVYFRDLRMTVEEVVDGEIWMVRIEKVNE